MTSDPYEIWVSEVMLQQTQVATALPYYQRWLERFPTPEALAVADEQEALSLWQGLGYYRRCRLLQQGAMWVRENGLPQSSAEWRKVPGVGPYTAGAIASITLGEASPVVDGNVERVYARISGDETVGAALHRNAWKWAEENMHSARPGDWNQSLMELGATVCCPQNPICSQCPLRSCCQAFASGRTSELPKREPKPKPIHLQHEVWAPVHEGRLGVRQIPPGEWWQGMWEFPRTSQQSADSLRSLTGGGSLLSLGEIRHTVTRHKITISAHLVQCDTRSEYLSWETPEALQRLPMPAPQRRVLKLALPFL